MSEKELPTSIKVIAWFYQIVGGILIFLGILALFGVTFVANLFGRAQAGFVGGIVILLILGGLGFLVILLGRGLLSKNKVAWWVTLVLSALNTLSLLLGINKNLTIIRLLINIFILWKLLEHRLLFIPEGLPFEAKGKKVKESKERKAPRRLSSAAPHLPKSSTVGRLAKKLKKK